MLVNIPKIAKYEWHPFTISSSPEQPSNIWLHIRGVGTWTKKLHNYYEEQEKEECERNSLKRTAIRRQKTVTVKANERYALWLATNWRVSILYLVRFDYVTKETFPLCYHWVNYKNLWKFGRTRNLHSCFYNSLWKHRKCFLFLYQIASSVANFIAVFERYFKYVSANKL